MEVDGEMVTRDGAQMSIRNRGTIIVQFGYEPSGLEKLVYRCAASVCLSGVMPWNEVVTWLLEDALWMRCNKSRRLIIFMRAAVPVEL